MVTLCPLWVDVTLTPRQTTLRLNFSHGPAVVRLAIRGWVPALSAQTNLLLAQADTAAPLSVKLVPAVGGPTSAGGGHAEVVQAPGLEPEPFEDCPALPAAVIERDDLIQVVEFQHDLDPGPLVEPEPPPGEHVAAVVLGHLCHRPEAEHHETATQTGVLLGPSIDRKPNVSR